MESLGLSPGAALFTTGSACGAGAAKAPVASVEARRIAHAGRMQDGSGGNGASFFTSCPPRFGR
jgi:hypothetical protein